MSQIDPANEVETTEASVANGRIVGVGDSVGIDVDRTTTNPEFVALWRQNGPYVIVKTVMVGDEDYLYLAREKCKVCGHCEPVRVRAIAFK